uniref:SUMO-activating enzyme subunit 2 n=1 Tax=Romanomermis culicivorax TaxID=13658 RepID=A0A915KWN3_ROMCU
MSNLWKKRSPPVALNVQILEERDGEVQDCNTSLTIEDQKLWTLIKCKSVFTECVTKLKQRFDLSKSGDFLIWDKDDDLSMDFVTACANLRSFAFHIPLKSRFEIKSMAGNIIPAIATTNAVVAGLIVMELFNLHNKKFNDCATTYLLRKPNYKGKYFVKCVLFHPNPKCYVCSEKSEVLVKLNTEQFTVQSLEQKILKQHLHMVAPDVEIDDNKGTIIISSEKGEICGLDNKTLSSLNINDGTRLNCDDFKQHFVLRLVIANSCDLSNDEFEIQTDTSQIQPKVEEPNSSKKALDEENDITEIVETTTDHISETKRKTAAAIIGEDEEILTKRARVA